MRQKPDNPTLTRSRETAKRDPLVSVVIPTCNRADDLAYTLDRLRETRYSSLEVIVVDNASTDGTPERIADLYPEVRLIRLPDNRGAAARNEGISASSGEFVLMLDSDSHPLPGTIGRMVERFRSDPGLGVCAFRSRVSDDPPADEPVGSHNVFIGCGAGFRRAVLDQVGGFPEGYGFYVEEYDLSYRVLEAGWSVRYFEDLVVRHRKSTAARNFGRTIRYLVRNNCYLYARYFPLVDAARTLPWTLYRYWRIARESGHAADYLAGLAAGAVRGALALAWPPLPVDALECVVPERFFRRRLVELRRAADLHTIAFWGIGKDFGPLVRAARRAGLTVAGAFCGTASGAQGFRGLTCAAGVPVWDESRLSRGLVDALVVASSSPGETANALAHLKDKTNGTPVVPLFTYEPARTIRSRP